MSHPALQTVFSQLQMAKKLQFVQGIDALVEEYNPMLVSPAQRLVAHSEMSSLHPKSVKLYVRFCPSVSMEKIKEIKMHLETLYNFHCHICEWSLPIRLEISL